MKVAYIRTSTTEQKSSIEAQKQELIKLGAEKLFIDELSGKNTDRPQLQLMLEFVRENDIVLVRDFSRLARNTKDLLEIVETLEAKKVALNSHRENLDTSTASGKLMLTMLGAIAEFERANLLEKQKLGIEYAKQQGKYKGRKEKEYNKELFDILLEKYQKREINKSQMAKELNISRPKLDKLLAAA